jgi:hypothetical protein
VAALELAVADVLADVHLELVLHAERLQVPGKEEQSKIKMKIFEKMTFI